MDIDNETPEDIINNKLEYIEKYTGDLDDGYYCPENIYNMSRLFAMREIHQLRYKFFNVSCELLLMKKDVLLKIFCKDICNEIIKYLFDPIKTQPSINLKNIVQYPCNSF